MLIEIHAADLPKAYNRFANIVGASHWRRRVQACKAEIRGNPFLRDHLQDENAIAYQLAALADLQDKYGTVPVEAVEQPQLQPAACLVAQLLALMDGRSPVHAEQMRRRFHGAIRNPADMRGLQLEMAAATHFVRTGYPIRWPELEENGETYDLLVADDLEVECKSISNGKGRRIPDREIFDFMGLMRPYLGSTVAGLYKGLSVVMTVPDRLPVAYKDRQALAKALGTAIFVGVTTTLCHGATVRTADFDVTALKESPLVPSKELRDVVEGITGSRNSFIALMPTRAGGMLALTVRSQRDDTLLRATFDTLSKAAQNQLTGKRAGLLFTCLEGLNDVELRALGEREVSDPAQPTALRVATSKFLASAERPHLIGLGFISRGGVLPREGEAAQVGGAYYYFAKSDSIFWREDFAGLFAWEPSV